MNNFSDFLKKLQDGEEIKEFWKKFHELCDSLETVDIELFVAILPSLLKRIENDFSSSQLYVGVENLSKTNPQKGNFLYNQIVEKADYSSLSLIPSILKGLKSVESEEDNIVRIKSLLADKDVGIKKAGILSAAILDLENNELKKEFDNFLTREFKSFVEQEISPLFSALAKAYRLKINELPGSKGMLIRLLDEKQIEIQYEVVVGLNKNFEPNEDPDFYSDILKKLIFIETKYVSAYNTLVYNLRKCRDHPNIVIQFLEEWLVVNPSRPKKVTRLTSVFVDLYRYNKEKFEELVTNWLNSDNHAFHIALFHLFPDLGSNNIKEFSLSRHVVKSLSPEDLEFIIYKIIGYVYDWKLSSVLLFSILESRFDEKRTVNLIRDVFINYLIFNYYSCTEFLKDKEKDSPKKVAGVIQKICKESERYYDAFGKLPLVKELDPSEERLKHFNKYQSKMFSKSMEENKGNQNSFLDLVTTINFRVGKSSFAKYEGQYSEHMTPQLFSHSAELPRGEFIDPIGQAKLRLIWQNMERKK